MFSLIRNSPGGITNMTSKKSSQEKRNRMIQFKTSIPEIDAENEDLFMATRFLEKCGNQPGLTLTDFYEAVFEEQPDITEDKYQALVTAAIAIETMMNVHEVLEEESLREPTVH